MPFGEEFWNAVVALSGLAACLVLAITGMAGYRRYKAAKRKERLEKDFQMRRDFILNSELTRIQGMIEHQSDDLATVLKKLINAENPYDSDLLDNNEQMLHEQLDSYINYLEAVGSLRSRGWLQEEDYTGFWNYYFRRIGAWKLLCQYVSNPWYEWGDVVNWINRPINDHGD